jgi:hypothetical protein
VFVSVTTVGGGPDVADKARMAGEAMLSWAPVGLFEPVLEDGR